MKKLLITGSSGFLGWNLCHLAQKDWEVYGISYSQIPQIPGITNFQLDLRDFQELQEIFKNLKIDAVIHTAALSQPNFCQEHPQESYEVNVTASCNLAGLCADAEIPCIFTSTDLVFDGLNAPYKETDPVCPVSLYGEQKVMAEMGMLDRYPNTTICRLPLMFGEGGTTAKSFIQPMLNALRKGQELALFVDEFRTPASGKTAAQGLLLALEKSIDYRLHLGGKERVSRYDFIRLLVEVLGLDEAKITTCRQQDIVMSASRPPDVSLDSSLAYSLGYSPLSLQEEFERLRGKV